MGQREQVLRKEPKHAALVGEVISQIRSGTLVPGDRLPAIAELTARYGLSQRAAVGAIRSLVAKGLVRAKPRSGCYVAEGARELAAQRAGDSSAAAAAVSAQHLPLFLVPRARRWRLSIYVTDILPASVACWRKTLAAFQGTHPGVEIEMVSCAEGHLEDVLGRRHLDVVQTTPAVLEHIGRERFVDGGGLKGLQTETRQWLRIVRERLEEGDGLHGVPFSVTVRYLYVNLALARKAGVPETEPRSLEELVARACAFESRMKREGCHGWVTAGLQDELVHSGAVRCGPDGAVSFDVRKAEACLQLFAKARFTPVTCMDGIPLFLRGQLLYLRHCSFTAMELRERAAFPWAAYPVPVAKEAKDPGFLMVLAVSRETSCPHECLELIRHLTGREAQRRLGELGGNFPARADALFAPEVSSRTDVPERLLRTALGRTTLLWPERTRMEVFERLNPDGDSLDVALASGRTTVRKVVERLRLALAALCPGTRPREPRTNAWSRPSAGPRKGSTGRPVSSSLESR